MNQDETIIRELQTEIYMLEARIKILEKRLRDE